jgi:uncharacterized protein YjbI with pentapeptide repeats
MKLKIIASSTLLAAISLATPSFAANLEHTRQLISTKQCPGCDLTNAGLVMANLAGANLRGADLSRANLSRANLMGADLSGANLTGASLFGANLTGANLTGANLNAADLRDTQLVQANLKDASVTNTNMLGAVGLPSYIGTAEDFYRLGMAEAERDNFNRAIELFDQAIAIKPDLANAYLGRGVVHFQMGDRARAIADSQRAGTLYTAQNNQEGYKLSQEVIRNFDGNQKPKRGGSRFLDFVQGIATLAFQLFSPF